MRFLNHSTRLCFPIAIAISSQMDSLVQYWGVEGVPPAASIAFKFICCLTAGVNVNNKAFPWRWRSDPADLENESRDSLAVWRYDLGFSYFANVVIGSRKEVEWAKRAYLGIPVCLARAGSVVVSKSWRGLRERPISQIHRRKSKVQTATLS